MLFSGVFGAFMIYAGKMSSGDLLFVTGAMWCPALATFATKKIFSESVRELAWQWGDARYIWLGYLIPILYALPVYVIAWVTGLGAFNWDAVAKIAENFGWQRFPRGVTLALFIVITASVGLIPKLGRALGEEIGWRGFLVPELAKVLPFPMVGIVSGLIWAGYHYPVLLFADYNANAPRWYTLICFTMMVTAGSIVMAWLVLRAGSLWPAAILHASHNLFIQSIFTPLTRDTGPTKYVIDEFGVGTCDYNRDRSGNRVRARARQPPPRRGVIGTGYQLNHISLHIHGRARRPLLLFESQVLSFRRWRHGNNRR